MSAVAMLTIEPRAIHPLVIAVAALVLVTIVAMLALFILPEIAYQWAKRRKAAKRS